ncbi:MAG: FHA domain-containing protein [Clostridia bacterium]|nr:FHA domain-containing protein [Clostridia bacterium]
MATNDIFEFTVGLTRYLLAGLAVLIIGSCVFSLVTRQFGSRVGSYLVETKTKKRLPLTRWENSIGRSPTCDVILSVATVSRFHAVISKRRTGWVVADTGSRTGVFVNGEQIEKPVELNHGDKVSFGTAVFEFFDVDVDDLEREKEKERRKQARIAARNTARTGNAGVEFIPALIDEAAEKAYIIGCESCMIGRSPDCDIRLRYQSVSSEHARVFRQGGGWYIEDCNSVNGTKINARSVGNGRRRLRDGDVVGLGGVIFVFNEHYKIRKTNLK